MGEAQSINLDLSAPELHSRPLYRRLGLLNGLLIGAALALGAWGPEAWRVGQLPTASYLPSLLLGFSLVIILCGFTGWLTSRLHRTSITFVLWIAAAAASMLIMGYLPTYGRTLAIWLADPRFQGRMIFPNPLAGGSAGLVLGGLLIILTLGILGLLQSYRLEGMTSEASHKGRLNGRSWLSLLLPMPLVFLASMVTQSVMSNPAAASIDLVHRAISVAQDHNGDLRLLNLGDGISYAALAQVQDQIGGDFTLSLVDSNPLNSTVIIGADFASAEWVYCRVVLDQLSLCYDASPPYIEGLRSMATGVPPAEDCRGCILQATDEAAAWLAGRRERFGPDPAIERVAQQGSHVLMRVTGDSGFVADCWVVGVTPMRLMECGEVVTSESVGQ